MKLFELAATTPSKQAAKVFESYFGDSINVDVISTRQARTMLKKVSKLVNEHRATPAFHSSEQNPTYLKLMMMERVLRAKVKEEGGATVGMATTVGSNFNQQQDAANAPQPNPVAAAGDAVKQAAQQQQLQAAQQQQKNVQQAAGNQTAQMQAAVSATNPGQAPAPGQQQVQEINMAMAKVKRGLPLTVKEQKLIAKRALQTESRQVRRQLYNVLRESEIQQAQVVLAARAMVDDIQKMLEEVSSMQFKDLPALVDEMKNQVGVDQAMQFNQDAVSALGGLVQNIQSAKQQMDQALGIVTGQASPPPLPGQDQGAGPDQGGMPGGAPGGEAPGGEAPPEEAPPAPDTAGIGRAKR
jgi:hypothetical protein